MGQPLLISLLIQFPGFHGIAAGVGLFLILWPLARPSLHTLRALDLLSLIGCGMCFGVALTLFIFAFKSNET